MGITATSRAQLNQDLWVLQNIRKPGYFVEFGAFHPHTLSNTSLLEEHGWRGVSVDPFPAGDWTERPNTTLIKTVVTADGREVEFIKGDELGGIVEHVNSHRDKVADKERVRLPSMTPMQILEQVEAPTTIEYMSIDVEGAELEILEAFPFDAYTVKLLTVEHNYEEQKRTQIRNFLRTKDMHHIAPNKWDDCYVHASMLG